MNDAINPVDLVNALSRPYVVGERFLLALTPEQADRSSTYDALQAAGWALVDSQSGWKGGQDVKIERKPR